jgi:hypothetical protein
MISFGIGKWAAGRHTLLIPSLCWPASSYDTLCESCPGELGDEKKDVLAPSGIQTIGGMRHISRNNKNSKMIHSTQPHYSHTDKNAVQRE